MNFDKRPSSDSTKLASIHISSLELKRENPTEATKLGLKAAPSLLSRAEQLIEARAIETKQKALRSPQGLAAASDCEGKKEPRPLHSSAAWWRFDLSSSQGANSMALWGRLIFILKQHSRSSFKTKSQQ